MSAWSSGVGSSDRPGARRRRDAVVERACAVGAVPARRRRAAAAGGAGKLRSGPGLDARALPQHRGPGLGTRVDGPVPAAALRRAYLDRSEEHTSELQSLMRISYAVFCLQKKITKR